MRVMQVANFYSGYLEDLYTRHPELAYAPYHDQMERLIDDGFSGAHIHVRELRRMGCETLLAVPNNTPAQWRWLSEHGDITRARTPHAILAQQVAWFRPEVLYVLDCVSFDSAFMRSLPYRPRVIVGWRGFPVDPGVDWSAFDLILTSFDALLAEAPRHGARGVARFYPGFSSAEAEALPPRQCVWDVVFSGQVTARHSARVAILKQVIEWHHRHRPALKLGLFMPTTLDLLDHPNQGAVWARRMHHTLRRSRLVLNIDVDSFDCQPPNMRLIEATGCGTCLLTPHHHEMPRFFEPGREVVTFRSGADLLDKLAHYLDDAPAREAIAAAGQKRCLTHHNLRDRARWLAGLFLEALAGKSPTGAGEGA